VKCLFAPLALMVLLLLCASGEACTGPSCNFDTLRSWGAKMAAAHVQSGAPPVHILQIGDSHTAGDQLTGGWRDLLQAGAGGGGRGVLPPGRPYPGVRTRGVTVSVSPGWRLAATFGPGSAEPRPPLGLSGFSLTSTLPGATLGLVATPAMAFDRFILCGLAGGGSRSVLIRTNEGSDRVDLASDQAEPRCTTLRWGTPQTMVDVIANDGPATITSWASFRDNGGVALSNLGVIGSQLQHFARTDDAVLATELRAYSPDLIVLAFGTNEGFAPRFDGRAYARVLRTQIGRLRALAPGVPILLLGAPDALSRLPALHQPGVIECGNGLFAPAALAQVRSIQRQVAGDLGVAWWDWQARMGGPCSARQWVESTPPRMRTDYVHFTSLGGAALAQLLHDDLRNLATETR